MNIKETKEKHARWRRGAGLVLIVIGALVLVRTIFAFLGDRPVELHQTFVGEGYDSLMLLITFAPLVGGALLLPDIEIDEGNRRVVAAKVFLYLGLAVLVVGWVLWSYQAVFLGELRQGWLISMLFDSIGIVAVAIGYFVMPRKRDM